MYVIGRNFKNKILKTNQNKPGKTFSKSWGLLVVGLNKDLPFIFPVRFRKKQ